MGRAKDMRGMRFGALTVLDSAGVSPGKGRIALWRCRCDCGSEKVYYGTALRSGSTKSCGCEKGANISKKAMKHGMTDSPTFLSWKSMKNRCGCETSPDYPLYGGRGIKVCERWASSFQSFLEDMGERPDGMTLDRIDSDGDYTRENCRWATSHEQANNKRTSVFVPYMGDMLTLSQFAERIGMDRRNVRYWIVTKGESPEKVAERATVSKSGGVSTVSEALS